MESQDKVPIEEAAREVRLASRRLGLLHLAYAETLIEKLGEKEGKELIMAAVKNYGKKVGQKARELIEKEGLEPVPENFGKKEARSLPKYGMNNKTEEVEVNGEKRLRAYGCEMAKVWEEYGKEELGKLYCFVDPAKFMGYNSNYKMIHTKNKPSHDDYCEFAIRKTTEQERQDFSADYRDWSYIDQKLT